MRGYKRVRRKKGVINLILLYVGILIGLYLLALIITVTLNFLNPTSLKVKTITRQEVFDRAISMINYTWEYKKIDAIEGVTPPYYLNESGKFIGIPYCYGGQFSLDHSNVEGIGSFQDALNKNYYPGNINTKNGYVKGSAGVDCSGFVASAFNIKERISTSTMDKYFGNISLKKIKPMDIINSKGRHVYIYLGTTKDEKGIIILESTSNGLKKYKDKTVVNYKTMKEFKKDLNERNYSIMRYKGIRGNDINNKFDSYEFNNNERNAKIIENNQEITGSIDYLEDIDYYNMNNIDNKFINVSSLQISQKITIYNNEKSFTIDKKGKYEIDLKGKVYIKVELKGNNLKEKSYSFEIFNK
ncbi:hypothetical protein [Clostridium cylindrosporum]|uniref:NlpC/P60 family protein n=1 Tax=Clostridium cylindrosporum DSM 605 TaxID=1121307 RepID=A0A0J8DFU3_CLOCY|nr:hypothetical protein [Clostridium cylindrosporum]KMT23109.1 hypothetical protein CLCY_7c01560 [Clostridium cylindrosporum DSM 605]